MDKRPRNPRVKKSLLKDFGEEQHTNIIGTDGADETDDEIVSNTKFYHLRDLPRKKYLSNEDDDGESCEDFSPVVSEYIPTPERRNHTSTPSSSLGGDSEYIEAVQSKLSRTPSTISNLSLTLNQINFVASLSEVFIADSDNNFSSTPKTKNQKRNYIVENLVNIELKPPRIFHQNQICTADFGSWPASANNSPKGGAVRQTEKHTKAMQITDLDTTLKPEETSALNLTLRSSLSDSNGSFSIINNLPLIVSSSCELENDLPSTIKNVTKSIIVSPSKIDPSKYVPTPEIIVPSTDSEPSEYVPAPEIIVPSTDAEPSKYVPAPEIIVPATNAKPRETLPDPEMVVPSTDSEPSKYIPAPEIIVPSTDAEPSKYVPAPEIIVPSTNAEPSKYVPAPEIILPSTDAEPREYVPAPEIFVPSTDAEPSEYVPAPEIVMPSTDAEPREYVPAPEIFVPSTDAVPREYVPVTEIVVPSTDTELREYVPAPEIVMPATDAEPREYVPAPEICMPSNAERTRNDVPISENHAPPFECENDVSVAETTKNRSRKRKLDIDNWQCKKNKKLKDSGLAYKGCHIKKEYPAKTLGPACTCKKACSERISPQERKEIFDKYYKIGNHEHQWQFIVRNVEVQDIKRTTLNRKCNRTQTLKYYFHISGVKQLVCKIFFLKTLNISDSVIYTALEKVKRDESLIDLRGSHRNRPHKTNSSTEHSVVQHINLFPTVEAHYVRKDSEKLYLHEDLNISKLYRLYKKWFAEQDNYHDVPMATARQYRKIFNTQFNYSFFKPKKDQCAICTRYEQAEEETKISLQINYDKHIKNKETVRKIKDAEKEKLCDLETIAIFDLEKVLYIPKSEVGVFYYKRKYPVYNFTVFDAGRKLGYCFMWHFSIAKRGANEIGSCILKFLENEHKRSVNRISLYSDGCRGQNKNRFIFALYLYAAAKFEMNITHRFFETGHSQNEGDSMHACIERELKKNKFVYTPEQMYGIAMNAKVTGEKYNVVEMDQSEFVNIKLLIEGQNWVHDTNGDKIMWTNIMEVNACHTHPGKLKLKYSFEDEYLEFNTYESSSRVRTAQNTRGGRARVTRARSGHIVASPSTTESTTVPELQRAYSEPFPVSKALHSDLLSLCKSHDIPRHYHDFYESLTCETGENVEAQLPLHEDDLDLQS